MSNPDNRRHEDDEPMSDQSKVIGILWCMAVMLFTLSIILAASDAPRISRLIVASVLALSLVLLFAVASVGDRFCLFASLLLVAFAPAFPFAWAAYGHPFWQAILAGVALLATGVVVFVWCCRPQEGGVK